MHHLGTTRPSINPKWCAMVEKNRFSYDTHPTSHHKLSTRSLKILKTRKIIHKFCNNCLHRLAFSR